MFAGRVRNKTGRGAAGGRGLGVALVVGALGTALVPAAAHAQQVPLDPYPAAPPPPARIVIQPPAPPAPPPAPAPPAPSNSGTINNNNNTNTVSPTITANPTNNNTNTSTNTNDNRSSATATNNNTIYIYPPALPPPAPPIVPPPTALSPPRLVPPPLVPPPAYGAPYYRPQRIRLNCRQLCGVPPRPVYIPSPMRERVRYISFGTHVTALGMAHQPLGGWGTMYGGGFQLTVRSRGRFGFEISQDFLRGEFRYSDSGNNVTRASFPLDFTFRGYIFPNKDRYHFNLYFGAGFGAIASAVQAPGPYGGDETQSFLEWALHVDVGAELRYKWIALGLDAKVMGLIRDRNFGDGAYYGDIQDGLVPAKTWGLQGRGYLSFWF